ncbi:glycosyltransferase family 4 protein [Thermococcus barophilus]|uniref:Glycosyl transferase, group 1 n=1 Tax=Thermococcus barophilus (strain DSM 11836 / MP) TaxID=391623 RepID=F0LLX1_THEBM|nr:glycosyltransferase family 4 protein [Thermococcus barophilus]ADT85070.1 glycosyl transferase, group 1 [Thermococcus barophilus MP]
MKILQICDHFKPAIDGVANYVYNLSNYLSKRHQITVLTSDVIEFQGIFRARKINIDHEKYNPNVEITRIPAKPPYFPYARGYYMLSYIAGVLKEMVGNVDVVHTHSYMLVHTDFVTFLVKVLSKHKKPLILTVHGYGRRSNRWLNLLSEFYNKSIGKWVLSKIDKIIVLDPRAKRYFIKIGVSPEKIVVIPNGIDYESLQSFKENVEKYKTHKGNVKTILYVGRLQKEKGVKELILAFNELLKKEKFNLNLLIVGDGPQRQELENLVRKLGIEDKVMFTGYLTGKPLLQAYYSADVFILPSKFEGVPTAILEAMATGLPIIATKVGGIPWIVKEERNGYLVDTSQVPSNLINTIIILISNQKQILKISTINKKDSQKYDWKNIAKNVEKTYIKVMFGEKL